MKLKNLIPLQRLIAKVDNDFNISESDWIPRASAWTIDALGQMKCLPMEKKRRELEVVDRIATFPCPLDVREIKVYDKNGCEIPSLEDQNNSCCSIPVKHAGDYQIGVFDSSNKTGVQTVEVATVVSQNNRNYVIAGNNIELSFDTDRIIVESLEVATYYDEYYDTEVPYIYDNAYLLEALSWWILFKYLSRGSKHQTYSLTAQSPILNPFAQWNNYRVKAINSVAQDLAKDKDGWNNFFYNSTFLPRS